MKNIWVPLSGAIAQQTNVETIANNVANANTPGFKRDQMIFKEHLTALEKGYDEIDLPHKEWRPSDFYRSYGAEHAHVKAEASFTDFTQGQMVPTGNPLDLAIHGKGFFEVLTPNGIRFTRAGALSLSSDGKLVTTQGFPVLSPYTSGDQSGGEGLQDIDPSARAIQVIPGKISINLQGEVFSNNQKISDLSIVEFKDPNALRKEGSALFINKDNGNRLEKADKTVVHQGFIEQSNVNAVNEMSNLIKANRHFESIQKVIKAYDNMAGKSVNEISRF